MMPCGNSLPFNQTGIYHRRSDGQLTVNCNIQHYILPSKYNILYINLNSFPNNLDDLEVYVHSLGIEIYIIAVTNIKIHFETSRYCNLLNYNSFFSTNECGEGGVALFIHKSLTGGVTEKLESDNLNCLIAHIPVLKINIGILYQNPNAKIDTLLDYYDSMVRNIRRTTLFCDTNIDHNKHMHKTIHGCDSQAWIFHSKFPFFRIANHRPCSIECQ